MSGTSSAKSRLTALKADVPAARKTRRAKTSVVALGPRFEKALLFAKRKHAGQTRKETSVPYLAHLLAVASLVLEAGGKEDMAIAALLPYSPLAPALGFTALPPLYWPILLATLLCYVALTQAAKMWLIRKAWL